MSEERKRQGRKIPEVLTTEEQAALLRQPNPRYPTGERNRLMISLMLNTGLRLSEATGLHWRDVDLNTGKVMVRQGKGARDRALWVGEDDLKLLRRWRQRQAKEIASTPAHIFAALKGTPVSNRYVQEVVKRLALKAGIVKDVHPHMLRHTFATDLYRQTTNIRLTQRAAGHADVTPPQIYTHLVSA